MHYFKGVALQFANQTSSRLHHAHMLMGMPKKARDRGKSAKNTWKMLRMINELIDC